MLFKLTPKIRRKAFRILPFGVIWFTSSMVFLFVEQTATGYQNLDPSTAVTVTFPVLIFASIAITFVGFIVGFLEIVVLEKVFRPFSLGKKIFLKLLTYLLLFLFILTWAFPTAASIESGVPIYDERILKRLRQFFLSITFISTVVQLTASLLLSLLYSAVSENLGQQILFNFFTGKYHKPQVEKRIFMFLDMKSSTTIAEHLGHICYFDLLKMYYDTMSDAIINHSGEVYQYIGDEVVITWELAKGIDKANCLQCYFALKESMQQQAKKFKQHFGVIPDFKAGMHLGEVTTGEIGALKKEIVFTGDVLNTTARIQGLCKDYEKDLILSEELMNTIPEKDKFQFNSLGELNLRGKSALMNLYSGEKI